MSKEWWILLKQWYRILAVFTLLMFVLTGCSFYGTKKESQAQNKIHTKVPYKMYFKGFVVLPAKKGNKKEWPPMKVLVFTNQSDWKAFYQKYYSQTYNVASMSQSINWKKDDLIYWASPGAQSWYTNITPFLGYTIKNHQIYPKFKNIKHQQNQTLAVNEFPESSNVRVLTTIWTLVKKKDVPKDTKNFYKKP